MFSLVLGISFETRSENDYPIDDHYHINNRVTGNDVTKQKRELHFLTYTLHRKWQLDFSDHSTLTLHTTGHANYVSCNHAIMTACVRPEHRYGLNKVTHKSGSPAVCGNNHILYRVYQKKGDL